MPQNNLIEPNRQPDKKIDNHESLTDIRIYDNGPTIGIFAECNGTTYLSGAMNEDRDIVELAINRLNSINLPPYGDKN